jgi:hypothetical protein
MPDTRAIAPGPRPLRYHPTVPMRVFISSTSEDLRTTAQLWSRSDVFPKDFDYVGLVILILFLAVIVPIASMAALPLIFR